MNQSELINVWKQEENAGFSGWDFSHLDGRWQSTPLGWDYLETVKKYLKPTDALLDMGTGGGEVLLKLSHDPTLTSVTEGYADNYELCMKVLSPMGITVKRCDAQNELLPFDDAVFDVVINRHDSYRVSEIKRVLKPGGYFITQQVGSENNAMLSRRLDSTFTSELINHSLAHARHHFLEEGFTFIEQRECFPELRFFDIGAIVYFAKHIPWEFPRFSVDRCKTTLFDMYNDLEIDGYIPSREHRFMFAVKRP